MNKLKNIFKISKTLAAKKTNVGINDGLVVRGQDAKRLAEEKAEIAGAKWRADAEISGAIKIEIGGPKGLEPTRYGDWEKAGRCSDF